MTQPIRIGDIDVGQGSHLFLIAGPCVIESAEIAFQTAQGLQRICAGAGVPFIFKSSFDKANRSSLSAFRGPGRKEGLKVLADIRRQLGVPVISDIHSADEAGPAAEVLDALQIPAFLCRQTDLILAAARTGKPVNIKKGQFLAPWDMKNIVEKFVSTGSTQLLLTERGTSFGYNNLVVDFRGLPIMRSYGYPVVFDVTHSLQLPGGQGTSSGGQREFCAAFARAAAAVGVDGLFMEVHPDPDHALCDGPNMVPLDQMQRLLRAVKEIDTAARKA